MSIASEGQRVDNFYTHQPKPAELGILAVLKINFEYLECRLCTRLLETSKLTPEIVQLWRLDKSILKHSILGVAHATCPLRQELEKQFSSVFRQ